MGAAPASVSTCVGQCSGIGQGAQHTAAQMIDAACPISTGGAEDRGFVQLAERRVLLEAWQNPHHFPSLPDGRPKGQDTDEPSAKPSCFLPAWPASVSCCLLSGTRACPRARGVQGGGLPQLQCCLHDKSNNPTNTRIPSQQTTTCTLPVYQRT